MRDALAGVRILDLTSYLSGPFATLTLAGLGADVIKIERKDGGDPSRTFPPFCGKSGNALRETGDPDDESIAILKRNRGKRSLTLNLESAEGKALFLRLVKKADVVIENLAPGILEKWGLGYDILSAENPRVVLCSISGFGRTGPKAHLPAFDPIVQASSLTMATNGYPDLPPTRTGISFGDTVPALYAVIGILAALQSCHRTGRGRVVDIAMHDSLVSMLMIEPLEAQVEWGFPLRTGSRIPRLTPCNVYKCRDGHVALNAAPPRLWKRFAAMVGNPELSKPELIPLAARLLKQEWIEEEVARWTSTQTMAEIQAKTDREGVPCMQILDRLEDLLEEPSLKARDMLHPLEHPTLGVLKGLYAPSVPVMTPGESYPPLSCSPVLGQHTEDILKAELGLSEAEIKDLEQRNII